MPIRRNNRVAQSCRHEDRGALSDSRQITSHYWYRPLSRTVRLSTSVHCGGTLKRSASYLDQTSHALRPKAPWSAYVTLPPRHAPTGQTTRSLKLNHRHADSWTAFSETHIQMDFLTTTSTLSLSLQTPPPPKIRDSSVVFMKITFISDVTPCGLYRRRRVTCYINQCRWFIFKIMWVAYLKLHIIQPLECLTLKMKELRSFETSRR